MPACASENLPRFWSSSPPISRSNSVSPPLPSSPLSTSPPQHPSFTSLKRSVSNVSNSSTASNLSQASNSSGAPTVIFAPRRHSLYNNNNNSNNHHHHHTNNHHHPNQSQSQSQNRPSSDQEVSFVSDDSTNFLSKLFYWYFGAILGLVRGLYITIGYILWAPTLWVSAWVHVFWMVLQFPLTALKWFITILHTPASERARSKRCVLISGGSTVQAVHLARNFYKAGARVVVCEVEGLFGLAKYSIACSRYYTVPRPAPGSAAEYVKALKDIVLRERAVYYIPVSASNTAYYDTLAKPHLEGMGCECFVPSASDITALDDPLELLRRCRNIGLATPVNFVLRSLVDVTRLYEHGAVRNGRHVMLASGPTGMKDRAKVMLPPGAREFRNLELEINERRPWVVIRDPGGDHFITCTTVKDSRVVANVTCRVEHDRGLIPVERPDVALWLDRFFAGSFGGGKISAHLSFRLASTEAQELVAIGCRVGVSLPYLCYNGLHPRLVMRPCRHFSRQSSSAVLRQQDSSANVVEAVDGAQVAAALKRCNTSESLVHLQGSVLDKREALFVYWDPLPYCAYYHLQLPFQHVAGVIRAQPAQHNPPLALVQ